MAFPTGNGFSLLSRAAAVRVRDSRKRTVGLSWVRDQFDSRHAAAFRSFVVARRTYRPWEAQSA